MRWRNSPCSYFKSSPAAARRAAVPTRIMPAVSRAAMQARFTIMKLKKKKSSMMNKYPAASHSFEKK